MTARSEFLKVGDLSYFVYVQLRSVLCCSLRLWTSSSLGGRKPKPEFEPVYL